MLDASLDTSFWNIASQIGVVPYLFDFFRVHYCAAVKREIITTDPNETMLVYPQAKLFQMMEEDGRLHLAEPERPLLRFGEGEAHAIGLALERNWVLLINDNRPLVFARSLGMNVVSVPAFCGLLYATGQITYPAILGYLDRLKATTSPPLIDEARQIVAQIARQRNL